MGCRSAANERVAREGCNFRQRGKKADSTILTSAIKSRSKTRTIELTGLDLDSIVVKILTPIKPFTRVAEVRRIVEEIEQEEEEEAEEKEEEKKKGETEERKRVRTKISDNQLPIGAQVIDLSRKKRKNNRTRKSDFAREIKRYERNEKNRERKRGRASWPLRKNDVEKTSGR